MTANAQLSKQEQMIAYFVHKLGGQFGRTALMKFLYLADYESRRFLGRPISDTPYVWHHYGPYDHSLPETLGRLESAGLIVQQEVEFPTGRVGARFKSGKASPAYSLAPEDMIVLQYICEQYSQMDLQALLQEVVYETEPMLDAKERDARGEPLNMDLVNNVRRYELGLPFEELIERSLEARAGDTVSAEDLRASARDAIAA